MVRKTHEISFSIAGKIASSFRASFSSASSELNRLRSAATAVKANIRSLEEAHKKGIVSVDQYRVAHEKLTKQLERTKQAQERLAAAQSRMQELQQNSSEIRSQMVTTAAMAAPYFLAVRSAIEFESAMLGVAKQIEGARDESGKLTATYYEMQKQIQLLGRELPIPTNEIARMVEAGARMNVPKENLIDFTREVTKMATAFEMPADVIADQMGKIANVMGIPIQKISGLADTINYLDDNSVSKGGDIIGVLQRIGGMAKQVNLTEHQAAALASTFLSLGKSEEVAATASTALMRELSIANQQPKRFQKGLEMLGLTAEQVNKDMVKDAQGTILKVLDLINKLPKEKQSEATTLLFGKEYGDDVAALAGAVDEYRRQIEMLNDAERKGSMTREFQARLQSTEAQLQIMKNSATEAAVNIGTVLLPTLTELTQSFSKLTQSIAEFSKEYPNATKAIVMGSAALIAGRLGWLGLRFAINSVKMVGAGAKKLFAMGGARAASSAAQKAASSGAALAAGGGAATKGAGKLASVGRGAGAVASRAALPLAVVSEVANIAMAKDKTKATAQAAGGIGGGWAGAKIGAAIGTAIAPGIGTAIGGLLGGLGGYLAGKWGAGKLTDAVRQSPDEQRQVENTNTAISNLQRSSDGLKTSLDSLTQKLNQIQSGIGKTEITVTYAPVIHGIRQGDVEPVLRQDKYNLEKQLESVFHQRRRVSFG